MKDEGIRRQEAGDRRRDFVLFPLSLNLSPGLLGFFAGEMTTRRHA
jgi:hypothetical protein